MLSISSLCSKVDEKQILFGIDLAIKAGEIHAIMGPNGSGKSTLANVLSGHPAHEVTKGAVTFFDEDLLAQESQNRVKAGLMVTFQHPLEISGVNVTSFLRMIHKKRFDQNVPVMRFRKELEQKMDIIHMRHEFADRYLNEGFSGGEKKKMELLQALVLEPKILVLDEIDSGLDIDALKNVAEGISYLREKNPEMAIIVITHYTRIFEHIRPDFVHIMQAGKITRSGSESLAHELEKKGYENI